MHIRLRRSQSRWAAVAMLVSAASLMIGTAYSGVAMRRAAPQSTEPRRAEIERDWLEQETARVEGRTALTTAEDAAGACDGWKDGQWGFHTGLDAEPWWQVDLQTPTQLDRVVVYNRCDAASRADQLSILVSVDGRSWNRVYRHAGPTFYGATDGRPLVVPLKGVAARYVRCTIPGPAYLHLDEVEVYAAADPATNIALNKPCDQSSLSQWSRPPHRPALSVLPLEDLLERGRKLVARLRAVGIPTTDCERELQKAALAANGPPEQRHQAYLNARWAMRRLMLADPLLSFDRLLFVKRVNGSFNHMSDQHYGWWSRPGGGLYILSGFRSDTPQIRQIETGLPEGSYIDPDLSYDGKRILFGYCRYYPESAQRADKTDKASIPEDAFYHLYEITVEGTGLRRLTSGKYDDFSGRYLPDGSIIFLSTRRGASVQHVGAVADEASPRPDSFVRCGGDRYRPVSVYTLHRLMPDRKTVIALSPFENFEWTPNVCNDGRILYARWDYVDRNNMPFMKLWSTNPDGTNPQAVYGNHTALFHCAFEARQVPGSRKILFTASAHHAVTGGSLVMLDPARGMDGAEPIQRITPEVCFPEVEGWPRSYYMSPFPLSERVFLTAWGRGNLAENPTRGLGIYVGDTDGNLELLYKDPAISSTYPQPLRARPMPPMPSDRLAEQADEGRFLVSSITTGLPVLNQRITRLRIVAVPAKTQPEMNSPNLGVTADDPGKCVLGTVPVERDGSAYFLAPSGVPLFFQAIGEDGTAVQTMRTVTYVQPRQTVGCVGCHESRATPVANRRPMALNRPPSRITPGPDGSWPYRFDRLVQPVLDRHCVSCHAPGKHASHVNLAPAAAYETLVSYGHPSLREHVQNRYREGRSIAGQGAAATSALLQLLRKGHQGVRLDAQDMERFVTWMDTYAQRLGSFSPQQEEELMLLRRRWAAILAP